MPSPFMSSRLESKFPFLGTGAGLRPKHYPYIFEHKPHLGFFEIISENFMVDGGRPLAMLEKVRQDYPIVMHGVSMSLGSTDPLNMDYLKRLRDLIAHIQPGWVSDHLCWTGVLGYNTHDLLPLPYNEEALQHMIDRILRVQDFLGRRIAIENPSSYLQFAASTLSEWDFMAEMAQRADCMILLDVNNVFVSAFNHEFDAKTYIDAIPTQRVVQIHLAGHQDHGTHLLDTHDHPVRDEVWDLYEYTLLRMGKISTLIEWDDKIPEFPVILDAVSKAEKIMNQISAAPSPEKKTGTEA